MHVTKCKWTSLTDLRLNLVSRQPYQPMNQANPVHPMWFAHQAKTLQVLDIDYSHIAHNHSQSQERTCKTISPVTQEDCNKVIDSNP